jgi:hypothetical protein
MVIAGATLASRVALASSIKLNLLQWSMEPSKPTELAFVGFVVAG